MQRLRAKKRLLLSVFGLISLIIVAGVAVGLYKKSSAALFVESDPVSLVYVDGEQVGKTPFTGDFKSDEVTVKLVPESFGKPLVTYEAKVALEKGVKTIVRRVLGETSDTSGGETISFEKSTPEAAIAVVSTPDGASVKIDGQVRGVTPIKVTDLKAGIHQLSVSAVGFIAREFSIQTYDGYRLTAVVNLAQGSGESPMASPFPTPQPSGEVKPAETKKDEAKEVEILKTPTGFLRVRSEPSVVSSEVGRVEPGEKYSLLETDKKSGWFKIQLKEGVDGWVSNDYATTSAIPN
jgi:hypothetical protein